MNANLFNSDPRDFALELVENQLVSADHLLLCALKYMSSDDVRDMLDSNELSPRFDEEDEDSELEDWLENFDDSDYDVEAMRIDIASGNLKIGDDDKAYEYEHENIVIASISNGNFTQAKEQCKSYGLDYETIKAEQK